MSVVAFMPGNVMAFPASPPCTRMRQRCAVLPFFPYEMQRDYAAVAREADTVSSRVMTTTDARPTPAERSTSGWLPSPK